MSITWATGTSFKDWGIDNSFPRNLCDYFTEKNPISWEDISDTYFINDITASCSKDPKHVALSWNINEILEKYLKLKIRIYSK